MASKRRLATLYATCIPLSPLAPPSALIPPLLPSATCLKACKHCVFQEQNQQGDLWILNRARCCVPPGSYWQLYRQLIGGAMPAQQGRPAPTLAAIKGSHIYIRIVTRFCFIFFSRDTAKLHQLMIKLWFEPFAEVCVHTWMCPANLHWHFDGVT